LAEKRIFNVSSVRTVHGVSILVTGMTFGESEASAVTVSAFVVAFLDSVALWWTYLDRAEGLAREVITSSATRD
jgi:low temperature requirement protein LtrA